jgi:predicted nucleotidyltransferase
VAGVCVSHEEENAEIMIEKPTLTGSRRRHSAAADNASLPAIRRYARQVGKLFRPQKIILFGSYAYGQPNYDSDVDLLVVMPARNQLDQAAKIRLAIPAPFSMDLIVRTPQRMQERLEWGDSFVTEIVARGKVLYEENHGGVGKEGRVRPRPCRIASCPWRETTPPPQEVT